MIEKKNILLLTSVYPSEDVLNQTPVVHYFAREWIKMGHRVIVIHSISTFPFFYYKVINYFGQWITNFVGSRVNLKKLDKDIRYYLDDVLIFRFPLLKYVPHGKYSNIIIKSLLKKIVEAINNENFLPDIIIGHWINPQLELIYNLKKKYKSKTCLVLHDKGIDFQRVYAKEFQKFLADIDVIGFRSLSIKKEFEKKFGSEKKSFICSSGLPEIFLKTENKQIDKKLENFIFVGDLFKRKSPTTLIPALYSNFKEKDFSLRYVGNGAEMRKIKKLTRKYGLGENIKLMGKLTRETVRNLLFESDCFIMISENEAFGLVYLEAMAMGCLTICSKNEGIDGIIVHGVNGFLCDAGNAEELSDLIKFLKNMTAEEKKNVSDKAILTAQGYSDYDMARIYLNSILLQY